MSLQQLRRQLERMKELARERPAYCTCLFIEIVEGSTLTDEQAQTLEANRACYDQNHERAHTGFTYVEVPPVS